MAGKTTAVIRTSSKWGPFQRDLDRAAQKALDRAARIAEARIRAHETRVSEGGPAHGKDRHTKDSINRVPGVGRTKRGYVVSIVSPQPNALWQERGTHAHKGRPARKSTSARRKAAGVVSGVKPLRFFRKGLQDAFPEVIAEMKRILR